MARKSISSIGRRIMAKAKQIRKRNKGKKWTTCVKEAAKSLKK